jgi:hypothetical protein
MGTVDVAHRFGRMSNVAPTQADLELVYPSKRVRLNYTSMLYTILFVSLGLAGIGWIMYTYQVCIHMYSAHNIACKCQAMECLCPFLVQW